MMMTPSLYVAITENVASRLMRLREFHEEPISSVIERLTRHEIIRPHNTPATKPSLTSLSAQKYTLTILGEAFPVSSYGAALAKCLEIISDIEPNMLKHLEKMKGSSRYYVAQTRDGIHIDRPDLNRRFTIEFRPGWFVGTNYSRVDTDRILNAICRLCRLTAGKDIYLSAT